MSDLSVLIVGCGDVGSRLARQMLARGWQVSGLRRSVAQLPEGVVPIAADLSDPTIPAAWPEQAPDYLVYCVAASQHDEAGYEAAYVQGLRHVQRWLAERGQRPRRLLFVSSSSVFGQKGASGLMSNRPPNLTATRGASCSRLKGWRYPVLSHPAWFA